MITRLRFLQTMHTFYYILAYAYWSRHYDFQYLFWLNTFPMWSGLWTSCERKAAATVTQNVVLTSFPEATQKAQAWASKLKRNFHWES